MSPPPAPCAPHSINENIDQVIPKEPMSPPPAPCAPDSINENIDQVIPKEPMSPSPATCAPDSINENIHQWICKEPLSPPPAPCTPDSINENIHQWIREEPMSPPLATCAPDSIEENIDQVIPNEPISPAPAPCAPGYINKDSVGLQNRSPAPMEPRFEEDCTDTANSSMLLTPPMPILEKYTDIPVLSARRPSTPPKPILSPQVIYGTEFNTVTRRPNMNSGNKRKMVDESSLALIQCGAKKAFQEMETIASHIDEYSGSVDRKYHQNQNRDTNDSKMKEKSVQEGAEPRLEEEELDIIIIEPDDPYAEDSTSESRNQKTHQKSKNAPEETALEHEVSGLADENGSQDSIERLLNQSKSIDELISLEDARELPLDQKVEILLEYYEKLTEDKRRILRNCISFICKEYVKKL